MLAKKGLGKGIGALIQATSEQLEESSKAGVVMVDINKIEPNKNQPRKYFDEEKLSELAESISQFGIIQPLIVKDEGSYYSIIAGERRFRAARAAKIKEIPVVIKDYNALETLQVALIENIQRQDLNPIEEAMCYKRLIEEYFFNVDEIAKSVGKSKHIIYFLTTLLNLDERVQVLLAEEKIAPSHGRFLLLLKDKEQQFGFSQQIIENELSVRETEKLIRRFMANQEKEANRPEDEVPFEKKVNYRFIENQLKDLFNTKVKIKDGKNKGRIEIDYFSDEELDRLLSLFGMIKRERQEE